jgi:HSP20 family molecular chaperone IbpA
MKHTASGLNNNKGIRIIFEEIRQYEDKDVLISDLINWQPLYDLYVMADEVVVNIDIAGVDNNDFSVYVAKQYLVIDGVREKQGVSRDCCVFHNLEIPYGRFYRRIDFPVPVESRKCQHRLDNGILTLRFPILQEKIIPIEGD